MEASSVVLFGIIVAAVFVACVIFVVYKRQQTRKLIEVEEVQRKAEEEAQRQAEEGARRKTEEEARRQAEEEARRKAETEARRQVAEEEAWQKADKEAQRQAEEEAQRKAEKEAQWAAKSIMHKIAPEDRGGQPKKLSDKDDNDVEKTKALVKAVKEKTFSLRPEVVCWKDAHKWFISLEIQEEYQEYEGIVVTQDGVPIQKDDRGRWVFLQTTGTVRVRWEEVGYQKEITLEKPYLIFRLAGQKVNRGRRIQYATFGSYLVIVPDQWQRDEEISGSAKLSSEPVSINGYQAHYFLLERGSEGKIGFLTSIGESITADTRASRFDLIGSQLSDANEDVGPLFAKHPPKIKATDQNTWRSIKTIVVGQEGSGRKRWRTHFKPNPDIIEQSFPVELENRHGGWYFVRFYDWEDTLVESIDFRFASALKEIVVHPHSPLPSLDGHSSVPIEFVHTSGCAIRLAEGSDESLQVQRAEDKTVAVIPPNPVWDRTRWSIDIDDRIHTDAVILVQRVWWAIGDENVAKVQPHWSDKLIISSREVFSATSKQILWLRLPKERWTDTVLVGFAKQSSRIYKVEVTKKHIAIPLSDFAGYQDLEDKFAGHSLSLWIEPKGQGLQATVITILPDKPLPQVSERPLTDTRPIPEDKPTSHIPKDPDYSDTPVDCKCCSTCDFAIRFYRQGIRCTVGTWEEMVDWDTFYFQFATHICSRWQGEYKGPDGTMVSK